MTENTSRFSWSWAWQFGVGLLATLALWLMAIGLIIMGLTGIVVPSLNTDVTSLFLLASGLVLCGILILPSIGYAFARLFNRSFNLPSWFKLSWRWAVFLTVLYALLIIIGNFVANQEILSWLLLPPIHPIVLGLPILLFIWLATRGLSLRKPQMAWGIFATGLVVSPALILIFEMIAGAIVIAIGFFFLSMDQEALLEIQLLMEQVSTGGENIDALTSRLEPYLTRPAIAWSIFAFAAGIVPIIEETLKPLGVWLLPGKGTSAADGFIAGLLCGAGYALFENLALASTTDGWALAVSLRALTSLLHMATAGIMGWAIVMAWNKARYGLLLAVYLTSITLHGLWNGLTLLSISNFITLPEGHPLLIFQTIGLAAPLGLLAILVASLAILLVANRVFKPAPQDLPKEEGLAT